MACLSPDSPSRRSMVQLRYLSGLPGRNTLTNSSPRRDTRVQPDVQDIQSRGPRPPSKPTREKAQHPAHPEEPQDLHRDHEHACRTSRRCTHRVIQTNTFFHDVFKNDEECIKLQIVIDRMDLEVLN
ncbi:hypothetical protein PG997_005694 [Apiospora hydei]|uniref:Uncharacterized protein n=1 Tax=Apiospora hydei TaxID=1337664 RepID=A0ABR1WQY0_9PEZI